MPTRHVVIFKFKPGASEAKIQQLTDGFRELKNTIPGIIAFEHGVNNSPEGLNQGFTHVHMLTFTDTAARDDYLTHPDHDAFGEMVGGLDIVDGAYVVDFESRA